MKYILYGAGRNAVKLYAYLKKMGHADSIDCFCDQRWQELDGVIDGKECVDYMSARSRKEDFVVTVSKESDAYNEIVSTLDKDGASCLSVKDFFELLLGDKSGLFFRDYYQYCSNDNISIEYYKLKLFLQTNHEDNTNNAIDKKYIWFMPEFPFLKLVFGTLTNEDDVIVVDSWDCLEKIRQLDAELVHFFVFFQPWADRFIEIIDLLKMRFKNSFVFFYSYDTKVFRTVSLEKYKNIFDEIFIYDKEEAEKAEVSFYPGLYDKTYQNADNTLKKYDLVWSGYPHGRLDKLIDVYDSASKAGLLCHFVVVDDGTIEIVEREGIDYVERLLPENSLRITMEGKCSLDLKHSDDSALTIRVYEAVTYGLKILTDNSSILNFSYYDTSMMQYFDDIKEIDYSFIKAEGRAYGYEGEYRPITFLKFLEKRYHL